MAGSEDSSPVTSTTFWPARCAGYRTLCRACRGHSVSKCHTTLSSHLHLVVLKSIVSGLAVTEYYLQTLRGSLAHFGKRVGGESPVRVDILTADNKNITQHVAVSYSPVETVDVSLPPEPRLDWPRAAGDLQTLDKVLRAANIKLKLKLNIVREISGENNN